MIRDPFKRKSRKLCVLCVLCGCVSAACGQKGPPLAPIVVLPRPVTELTAKRVEGEIVLRFTVPTGNTDGSAPADLRRVEVYAHTGALPPTADFVRYGTLVSSIDIKTPATEDGKPKPESPKSESKEPMVEQGWTMTIREGLTEKHFEIGPMPPVPRPPEGKAAAGPVETLETPGTVNFDMAPVRLYAVVPVSRSRGRRGRFTGPIRVPLAEPLAAPEKPELSYTAAAVSLKWPGLPEAVAPAPAVVTSPAAVVTPPVEAGPLKAETEGTVDLFSDVETEGTANPPFPQAATAPAGKAPPPPAPRFGYNVYEVGAGGLPSDLSPEARSAKGEAANSKVEAAPAAKEGATVPLNAALLTTPVFSDPRVEFGTERCYVVRRVEMVSAIAIESAPSAAACVTPVDTFPPEPPKALQSIATGASVSLLWESNTDADLGGYLVLRGEAPGDKLAPLMAAPIADTSFVDNTVARGRTYVYEVVAVDKSTPANQSAPSNRVEEAIR